MNFLQIIWQPNPTFINIFGLEIRWYGVLYATGFLLGYYILKKIVKKENLSEKLADTISLYVIIGTIIGARLGHCLFYEPDYYLSNPLEILNLRQGGLASHGGALGVGIALFLFSRKYKFPFHWTLDRVLIPASLVASLIRIGNLINSEIYGIPTNLPWAFIFVKSDPLMIPRHPTQIYEALAYFLLFLALYRIYFKTKKILPPYFISAIFLISCFTFRFFVEFIKDVQVDFEKNLPLNMGQLLSIPFILIGIFFLFYSKKLKKSN